MRKVAAGSMQFRVLVEGAEHSPLACVPNGHSVRCYSFSFSGVQFRWAHRLEVYVPKCGRFFHYLPDVVEEPAVDLREIEDLVDGHAVLKGLRQMEDAFGRSEEHTSELQSLAY